MMLLPEFLRRRRSDTDLVIDLTTPEARSEYEMLREAEALPEKRVVDFTRPQAPSPRRRRQDDYPMLVRIVRKDDGRG
ncbi:hypothetical protein [Streptomyces sp. NPDC056144]|uniref:hypothetical protein n=1 Tax=unclassified Streptomyces TaxID=2593676 RepID=UPI0035DCF15C